MPNFVLGGGGKGGLIVPPPDGSSISRAAGHRDKGLMARRHDLMLACGPMIEPSWVARRALPGMEPAWRH